jgi:eukaryotic-like serine/threonine-protein kinase
LFTGANALVVLQKVAHDPPPRASDVVREGIPPELDDLVYRCVSKDPAERPASVAEMLEVVQSLMKTYVWTQEDARRWWRAFESEPANPSERARS